MFSKLASRAWLRTYGLAALVVGGGFTAHQHKDELRNISKKDQALADRLQYFARRFQSTLDKHQLHARGNPTPPPVVEVKPTEEEPEEVKPFSYIDVPPSCYPCPPCKNLRSGIKQSDLQYCTEQSNVEATRNHQFYLAFAAGLGAFAYGLYPSLKQMKESESTLSQRILNLSGRNKFLSLCGALVACYAWYWKKRVTEKVYFCPREDTFIYQTTKPLQMCSNLFKNKEAGQCEHNFHAVPQFTVQRTGRYFIKKMKEVVKNNPEGWPPSSIKVGNERIYICGHNLSQSMKCLLYAPGEEEDNNTDEECFSVEPVARSYKFNPPPVDKSEME